MHPCEEAALWLVGQGIELEIARKMVWMVWGNLPHRYLYSRPVFAPACYPQLEVPVATGIYFRLFRWIPPLSYQSGGGRYPGGGIHFMRMGNVTCLPYWDENEGERGVEYVGAQYWIYHDL